MQKAVLYFCGMVFLVVAAAHVVRLLLASEIIIAGWVVPYWISGIGIVVPLLLAWLCLHAAKQG